MPTCEVSVEPESGGGGRGSGRDPRAPVATLLHLSEPGRCPAADGGRKTVSEKLQEGFPAAAGGERGRALSPVIDACVSGRPRLPAVFRGGGLYMRKSLVCSIIPQAFSFGNQNYIELCTLRAAGGNGSLRS